MATEGAAPPAAGFEDPHESGQMQLFFPARRERRDRSIHRSARQRAPGELGADGRVARGLSTRAAEPDTDAMKLFGRKAKNGAGDVPDDDGEAHAAGGSLDDLRIADLVAKLRDEGTHEVYPRATEDDLLVTEHEIGRPLPPSFREFTREFSNGAYLFLIQEVSAVGAGNPQIGAIQNSRPAVVRAAAEALVAVEDGGPVRAGDLVPFSLDSNGNCWCFLAAQDATNGEYAVAYYASDNEKLYGMLPGFEVWLGRLIEHQDEVIRTLYSDAMILDELGLG
jgi:hypothetical protein